MVAKISRSDWHQVVAIIVILAGIQCINIQLMSLKLQTFVLAAYYNSENDKLSNLNTFKMRCSIFSWVLLWNRNALTYRHSDFFHSLKFLLQAVHPIYALGSVGGTAWKSWWFLLHMAGPAVLLDLCVKHLVTKDKSTEVLSASDVQ